MSEFAYRAEVHAIADRHGLEPDLVTAVCLVESDGRTNAYRYEPNFWIRYLAGKPEWDGANPHRVSASYGLMQCMYPVALEHGYDRNDPPEHLFIPVVGLEFGCRVLAERMTWASRAAADVSRDVRLRAALASYNGGKGGNAADHRPDRNALYADKVLFKLAQVKSAT